MPLLLLSSAPVSPCPPENQQLCQQRGDCAWPAASKAARTGQVLAGAAGAPHWEQAGPGCQGCRINKAAHRLARREGGHRQAGGRTGVSGAQQTQRTSCLLLSGPREQPPSSLSQAPSETSGQVSQGVLGGSEGQVLTSRSPCLWFLRGKTSPDWGARAGGVGCPSPTHHEASVSLSFPTGKPENSALLLRHPKKKWVRGSGRKEALSVRTTGRWGDK